MSNVRIFKEEQILDAGYRKKVIQEIKAPENLVRKQNELKKYDIYRDRTIKWVIEKLIKDGLKESTLRQMENRASNISICRKVVNKLARSYQGGVIREVKDQNSQIAVSELTRLLNVNQKMKKSDRYRQLHKNCMLQPIPELSSNETEGEQKKYRLKVKVLSPWQYDVIEDLNDHEQAKVVILSDFIEKNSYLRNIESADDAGRAQGLVPNFQQGNRRDETIADSPDDAGSPPKKEHFIWWSDRYHFVTDAQGNVISELSPPDLLNPIGLKPFVNVAEDQDGEFWAQGGDDLVDGSVLINTLITDMFSIAYIQGWGQMVVVGGPGVTSKQIEGGPHTAIFLEPEPGDTVQPSVSFESANPPLDMWMRAIEQYVALLLTTNDLSPSAVSTRMDAAQFPSGIAMLIEQSEATNSIEDKQECYKYAERQMWEILKRWQNTLLASDSLTEEFKAVGAFEDSNVTVRFLSPKQVVSEKEKLENLKARKDLGINTLLDLIKIDNPDLTEEEAVKKLADILKEKLNRMAEMMAQGMNQASSPEPVQKITDSGVDQEADVPMEFN